MCKIMKEGVKKGTISNEKPKINVRLVPADSVNLKGIQESGNLLGVIKFSEMQEHEDIRSLGQDFPAMNIAMKPFIGSAYYEIWTSDNSVNYGSNKVLKYATDGFHHFLTVDIEEDRDLRELGLLAYDSMFGIIKENNYKNISRVWNHIPNINEYSDTKERYTKFCHGRAESFQKNDNIYPAATGIGCFGDNLCIYMLSTSENINKYIENPNQTPAYKYPSKYGIKSPSFARAAYADYGSGCGMLYVSGTASIIGSETVHVNDVRKQCETTIDNIRVLISQQNLNSYGINKKYTIEDMDCIKVYVKNDNDFESIREICSKSFSADKSIVYLKADVCRNNLLVEIEGIIKDF